MDANREYEDSGRDAHYLEGLGDSGENEAWGSGDPVPDMEGQQKPGYEEYEAEEIGDPYEGYGASDPGQADAGVEPAGSGVGDGSMPVYGDAVYEMNEAPPDSLEAVYVNRSEIMAKRAAAELVIKQGLSGLQAEPKKSRTGLIVTLVALLVIAGLVGGVFTIRRPYVTPDLKLVQISLPSWIVKQLNMTPEERRLQKLTDDERAYLITRSRLFDVYPAMIDYLRKTGEYPKRTSDMTREGILEERMALDGWEIPFRLETRQQLPIVTSSGPDMGFKTPDDIRYDGETYKVPGLFEDVEDISFAEQ